MRIPKVYMRMHSVVECVVAARGTCGVLHCLELRVVEKGFRCKASLLRIKAVSTSSCKAGSRRLRLVCFLAFVEPLMRHKDAAMCVKRDGDVCMWLHFV